MEPNDLVCYVCPDGCSCNSESGIYNCKLTSFRISQPFSVDPNKLTYKCDTSKHMIEYIAFATAQPVCVCIKSAIYNPISGIC